MGAGTLAADIKVAIAESASTLLSTERWAVAGSCFNRPTVRINFVKGAEALTATTRVAIVRGAAALTADRQICFTNTAELTAEMQASFKLLTD